MADNVNLTPKTATIGLNLDSSTNQVDQGFLSWALNAQVENFDGNQVSYQNEQGNDLCVTFPEGYQVIGHKNIIEQDTAIYFLASTSGKSEIGKVVNCVYSTIINADCLNFKIIHPILKVIYKVTNCSTELYWTDGLNPRRFLDLNKLPYRTEGKDCEITTTEDIDCNKLNLQPDFFIPQIEIESVDSDGNLLAGTYQFAVQYSTIKGESYTSYYSVTNPLSVFSDLITPDFNFPTGKSINVKVSNLDTSGYYDYFNLAVIKTINNITSVELVGTYEITGEKFISYTGQSKTDIKLNIEDIFQKYPYYNTAQDIFSSGGVLGWADLTTNERINYQRIANDITLNWQTYRIPHDSYSKPINTAELKGYMRDEVYPFEIAFLLANGQQTDGFHIPGREALATDLELVNNSDVPSEDKCSTDENSKPRWQVYNTGSVTDYSKTFCVTEGSTDFTATIQIICPDEECTEQAATTAVFKFSQVTPEPITILLGQVTDNGSDLKYVGSNIFTPPAGSIPDDYYITGARPQGYKIPFEIVIPQGVTEYTADLIWQKGLSGSLNASWTCQSCIFPITNLYFKIENTLSYNIDFTIINSISLTDLTEKFIPEITDCTPLDHCYEGPYQYGEFAYWESLDTYPCNEEIWGDLANKPIRHHKFPDNIITHHHDNLGNIYPIGIRLDNDQIKDLIENSSLSEDQKNNIVGYKILRGNRANNKSVIAKGLINNVGKYTKDNSTYFYPNYPYNDLREDPYISTVETEPNSGSNSNTLLSGFSDKERYNFHSPDTHFYQPFLGNILKLETVEYGKSKGHVVQVKNHSKYKFVSGESFLTSLAIGIGIGFASNTVGLSVNLFNGTAAFTAYQTFLDIIYRLIPAKNFAYQFNSIGKYTEYEKVLNTGNKQRSLDLAVYASPGMISTGDTFPLNNYQRESSVYLRTREELPFPSDLPNVPDDNSRWLSCDSNFQERDISSYYASLKTIFDNQYGQIYSYETLDTGFQEIFSDTTKYRYIFGGDIFINRFAYKTKLPFFTDNRVGAPDESDVFYDEIGNIGYPVYWFGTDVGKGSYNILGIDLGGLFGVKRHNFNCNNSNYFYDDGKIYLFAYGIPYFYCESEVNVDYRQAYNSKEGDFFPRVSSDVPDDWLQESNVTILQDNTYTYNKTYSKQNKENFFSHIPNNFSTADCFTQYPFRAIISDERSDSVDSSKRNNWLIYKPLSYFDFPQNYGKLTSLDGIETLQVLARFENKSLLYNALFTAPSSVGQVYLGKSLFDKNTPPIDYAETDLGYIGSQHKFLLRTEFGHVTADSKRGQIFLLQGTKFTELTNQRVSKFFTEFLDFKIKKSFDIDIDNHYAGIGLHGVYDSKYNRLILTKLDYSPIISGITYDSSTNVFSYSGEEIQLTDSNYFCNNSFTVSYDFDNQAWISFHSYLPNFYVGETNYFYSGNLTSLWKHNTSLTKYNNFYGVQEEYIIEYPFAFKFNDEILQSVKDYTKSLQYTDFQEFIETDDYFTSAILYNNQQTSGILKLTKKPVSNLKAYNEYPKYNSDSKEILFTKSNNFYQINTFWALTKSPRTPLWKKSCKNLSTYKELNQDNCDYSKRSYKKAPLLAKDLKVRLIYDQSDTKLISQFILSETQQSYK